MPNCMGVRRSSTVEYLSACSVERRRTRVLEVWEAINQPIGVTAVHANLETRDVLDE